MPLYNYFHILKNHPLQIIFNLASPSLIPILSTPFIPNFFHFDTPLIQTLLPTSLTTPLPITLSQIIPPIPSLTPLFLILTPLFPSIIPPIIIPYFPIHNHIAIRL
ncbi:LrgB family protein, partial [Bacillus pumilus]|uniref:LrgB family protein n=1 Tax=Bacillus pumilus TaxID=1408 RepID=UPI0034D9823D